MQPDPKSILDFLKKDWLSQAIIVRYSFLFGCLLFFFFWLDKTHNLHFFQSIFDISKISIEQFILFLLGAPFIVTIVQSFIFLLRKIWYQKKYPLHEMNYSYHVIFFDGQGCIVDDKRKEIRWIKNSQTALDLNLMYEWTQLDLNIRKPSSLLTGEVITKDGKKLLLKEFRYVNGVYTRGVIGE